MLTHGTRIPQASITDNDCYKKIYIDASILFQKRFDVVAGGASRQTGRWGKGNWITIHFLIDPTYI
jgi:hypothetical protein